MSTEQRAPASWAAPGWPDPPPREICIVMLSAIGDAVHVLPVVSALRRTWPSTRITWIVQPAAHALVHGHPAVDELIVFRRQRGASAWRGYLELQRTLRERRFDLLLGLQVYLKAGLITALAPARVKLGFDFARARDAQWLFTNRRIPAHGPQHVQDQYFEFLRFLGVDPEPVTWGLAPTEAERARQRAFFGALDAPACAIVVGASKPEKTWSAERWARVCDELERRHGLRPVLVGGPARAERRCADEVLARTSARVVDALGDDVRALVWLLEGCALAISPDTGPLHVARAVGTPVVGLYGATDPARTGPYRAYGDLVVSGWRGRGERRHAMDRVSVEGVLEKVALAFERYPT